MAMIAWRLPVFAFVALASCSRAPTDDQRQAPPMVARLAQHPDGYSPPDCRSYTAALVGTLNMLLVMLVRPSQSVDQWRLEPPCRD